ncbi:hypothetical protein IGI04_025863 [Brassica rapa subsp. trilocularis]|uniref:Uncharacterized protein n=1 Tax=Brassica rapa subsp. trilocularis TaxID=1813537 RepID=A0ABQ7KYA3_BRACM|nr:hypothetical protein IGI04_025863 [Brassica rapa subsp. trilocularis]
MENQSEVSRIWDYYPKLGMKASLWIKRVKERLGHLLTTEEDAHYKFFNVLLRRRGCGISGINIEKIKSEESNKDSALIDDKPPTAASVNVFLRQALHADVRNPDRSSIGSHDPSRPKIVGVIAILLIHITDVKTIVLLAKKLNSISRSGGDLGGRGGGRGGGGYEDHVGMEKKKNVRDRKDVEWFVDQ